jgi:hypothetical protein
MTACPKLQLRGVMTIGDAEPDKTLGVNPDFKVSQQS